MGRMRLLVALGLALATLALVSAIGHLPVSAWRDGVTGALSLPGIVIGAVFFPQGPHSDGAVAWALLTVAANVAFYTLVWFVFLRVVPPFRRKREADAARPD